MVCEEQAVGLSAAVWIPYRSPAGLSAVMVVVEILHLLCDCT
jgi:hypothetical protein